MERNRYEIEDLYIEEEKKRNEKEPGDESWWLQLFCPEEACSIDEPTDLA